MKKFRFRLERVLQIKIHHEKERQKFLAQASQRVMNQETMLENLDARRHQTQKEQRKFLEGPVNPQMLSGYSRYYLTLKKNEIAGKEVLKAYRAEREKKRQDLVEATRQKKIYEKLKEKKQAAHFKEMELILQKDQDELASNLYNYKKGSREHREPSG